MTLTIHHHFIDKLAFLSGLVSGVALYPQIYVVLVSKSVTGVSLSTFVIILLNSLIWVLYAMHRNLISLVVASLLNAIASGVLIVLILVFR